MKRDPESHKGQNGKVAIIGGSRHIHGAPILSALATEASGVDLIYLALPGCHEDAAKQAALNFQVHPFKGNELSEEDLEPLLELLAVMDCAVIGPGLSRDESVLNIVEALVDSAACPLVLDAGALQTWTLNHIAGKTVVLTPHRGELERMGINVADIATVARENKVTVFVKGAIDRIAGPDGTQQAIEGGNAGLTVGGTGDVLAGLIAGLMAQELSPPDACALAGKTIKRAAEVLQLERGYAFTAENVIDLIPTLLSQ